MVGPLFYLKNVKINWRMNETENDIQKGSDFVAADTGLTVEEKSLQDPETQKTILLEKINTALSELGSTSKWKRAPDFLEGYVPLKDKTVVMVDDLKMILEQMVPYLLTATEGKASFIEFTGQQLEELIEQITTHSPDIVLVDYHLSDELKGTNVIEALHGQNFQGEVVGFSSDSRTARAFIDAGAKGAVDKGGYDPENSVKELAAVISSE